MKIVDIPPYQRDGVNMVNMKLRQSPRAYPTDALKAKPAFR